ncbi:hypothetical protein EC919_11830 [Pseudomonas graminis]|uniref:hypothetical protein n=1 Tax=Pseudomonas graminis TaxID=158627 RepID=UPI0010D34D72|nr:hypothetical protein [Pseudomonas graminis]TDV42312.1 hypothetical protein EC919_11830 [Pseudomonas graminis]
MPTHTLPYRFDSASLMRQRDLAPEEYAVYFIEVIGSALSARWLALRHGRSRQS